MGPDAVLESGKEVLRIEADAITALIDRLDGAFVRAVEMIARCSGRVIVTGMGKSGHIGRKLAGTLASTGTPSLFMHPAEAVHGDLGMITKSDVVLALCYSGETDEVLAILPAIKRIGAPIISLTRSPQSTLARYSEVVLDITVEREACPLGLAPTASSTATLALGDALAIAAMRVNEFSAEDYALFHPHGALGRRLLLRVGDVMRTGEALAVVPRDTCVLDVLFAITKAGAGAANIVDGEGKLIGLITDGDIRRALISDRNCLTKQAEEIMVHHPMTTRPELLAVQGLRGMEDYQPKIGDKIGDVPVVDAEGRPVGMLMLKDLARAGLF